MEISKKKAMKHVKQRCPRKDCAYCLRRKWLGMKWGKHLDVQQEEILPKEVQVFE